MFPSTTFGVGVMGAVSCVIRPSPRNACRPRSGRSGAASGTTPARAPMGAISPSRQSMVRMRARMGNQPPSPVVRTKLLRERLGFLPRPSVEVSGDGAGSRPRLRLFGLSFLMLFVELALIRWAGSNVIYLSYFSNFVLLGSFLGIGIGFLRARARRDLHRYAPLVLLGLVLFVRYARFEVSRSGGSLIFFGRLHPHG